jgi:homocitrate synthase NifV
MTHPPLKCSFIDTTLRDGEQTAGIVFSAEEKINIVKTLDNARMPYIEAGIPAMDEEEQEVMRALLALKTKAILFPWNRASEKDVTASIQCGFSTVHISVPVSDFHIQYKLKKSREWVLKRLRQVLDFARSFGVSISVGAEDASRADPEYFLKVAQVSAEYGAIRIRYADTVGCMEPFRLRELFTKIIPKCALPIEFHGHNDFGLATANSLAAAYSGVDFISVTSTGIGERAGNACLEEIIAAMERIYAYYPDLNRYYLKQLTQTVKKAVTNSMEQNKSNKKWGRNNANCRIGG